MKEKIEELCAQVGRPYEMFNEDGTYQGCFYPVQFLYPDKPRYKLRSNDDDQNYWWGCEKIRQHCTEVTDEDVYQSGDIVVTRFKNELHVAVLLNSEKIIHVFRNNSLQISRLKLFRDYKVFRVNR